MIKKLVKYGKILMALTLIGALSIPSYATVGASDGSAFVTKAEFDAALSDFNARLTTFEAGINSKIDSQVSSYLDRNGIWSGKDQTVLSTAAEIKNATRWGWNSNGSYNSVGYFYISQYNTSSITSISRGSGTFYQYKAFSPANTKFFTANKSGLVMFTLSEIENSPSGVQLVQFRQPSGSERHSDDPYDTTWSNQDGGKLDSKSTLGIYDGTTSAIGTTVMWSLDNYCCFTATNLDRFPYATMAVRSTYQPLFFVQKGVTYWIDMRSHSITQGNNLSIWANSTIYAYFQLVGKVTVY